MDPRPLAPFSSRVDEVRREIDAAIRPAFDAAVARVDAAAVGEIQEKYRTQIEAARPTSRYKYIDLPYWASVHALKARNLGLLGVAQCSILDIGSGGGAFLAICAGQGHQVLGLDQPSPVLYRELVALWAVPRVEESVLRGSRLSVGRFDLITALATMIDSEPDGSYWGLAQWQSFLNYLSNEHLNFPGRIYLEINKRVVGGKTCYCTEIFDACERIGATTAAHRGMVDLRLDKAINFNAPRFDDNVAR